MSYEQIPGWFDSHDIYDQAVAEAKPGDTLVEVGVAYGKSLAYLARQAITSRKRIRILGVDLWSADEYQFGGPEMAPRIAKAGSFYEACVLELMEHAPEEYANVTLLRMGSEQAAEKLAGMKPSFVFIDADHSYSSVLADLCAWGPIVKPGGLFGGHDCTGSFPGVEQAVTEYFKGDFERRGSSWLRRM